MDHPGGMHDPNPSGSDQDYPPASQRRSQQYAVPKDLSMSTGELGTFDWEQLHKSYVHAMEEHGAIETELRARIAKLLEIFTAWSQTTVVRDETRALKRFKTQMQHVQNSEESLEKRRQHYLDVVKAFESALALLNDRMKP
ncbi:hypothetical protein P170DRAFT_479246 [Aspergillus steynii IBT 23096]|uniref:Uncharacterized protein n=1 Tax=Aspergillus steynii IBT 23096 TaxID=1392250 RepID=A0A2I2FVM3_9EURO|nr:uncharacterized protein P170DRAFT_479246 [Aspergillus steynii IBT 23096]PLB44693.1 hypothetical protein P170DRAFT_479246 [Aspergillus steynii IBT 23096]